MKFDISKYLILGRENTKNRTVEEVVKSAVEAGFTFIQIRSKEESAVEMIEDCLKVSDLLKKMGKSHQKIGRTPSESYLTSTVMNMENGRCSCSHRPS